MPTSGSPACAGAGLVTPLRTLPVAPRCTVTAHAPPTANATLDVCLAGVNARVNAPSHLAAMLALTLANVPPVGFGDEPDVVVSVAFQDDLWQIDGADGSRTSLPGPSALPQLSGATVTRLVNGVAARLNLRPLRAAVIERDGRALALIGDDWESAGILAAHLHGRGWTYVGGDHALIDPATCQVFAVQKLLYVNATSIAQLPLPYRRAVEASPWYVTPKGISFFAVDPSGVNAAPAWRPTV